MPRATASAATSAGGVTTCTTTTSGSIATTRPARRYTIEKLRDSPAPALSGGERRRVEIARALAEGRPVIVEARDADSFRAAAADLGVTGRVVGEVNGHNYSKGDDVSLTIYAPPGGPVTEPSRSRHSV